MKYYCRSCHTTLTEEELIKGYTISAVCYENDKCCECYSDDIIEVEDSEICGQCGRYHEEDDIMQYDSCFEECYSDSRAVLYMMLHWKSLYFYETMAKLSDDGDSEKTKTTLWKYLSKNGEVKKFIQFVCEFDDARGDIDRDGRYIKSLENIPKIETAKIIGMYELIDTNVAV